MGDARADVGGAGFELAVVGAGVAGLWTAARAGAMGVRTVLVSAGAVGGGQTIASQGIIHGGIKYALTGEASRASRAIAEMPGVWSACMRGEGELDLRGVKELSSRQHLWTTAGLGSRLMAVAASKVIRTGVESLARGSAARRAFFGGDEAVERGQRADVYAVEEPVLEARSVVRALVAACERAGVEVREGRRVGAVRDGDAWRVDVDGGVVRAARVVLAAGAGNEGLLAGMGEGAGVKM